MKRVLSVLIFFLTLSVVTAATPIYNYETLTIKETISNSVVIIPTRSNYQIEYFDIDLNLFPQDSYRQTVNIDKISPIPNDQVFSWQNPNDRTLNLEASFVITTTNKPVKITEKVPFPLESVPLSITKYIKPTENIDINSDIRRTAQFLAQDVDDLFVLEHKLARWVNQNIAYNLSSLTADANYPASWVLDTGYGVCDELTNLFIAMNRALGIPARFVSGIAYSESILFDEKWGNHGWAEVYFPGYGWVPYDITYEEYGQIDVTHIEFAKEVDGTSPSIEYTTKGLYYNFEPTILDFDTTIQSYGNVQVPKTELDLQVQESSVSFGSYNLFELTLSNPHNYYVVEDVYIAKANELTYFHPLRQSIVLKPYEKKKAYWVVQVDPDLERNYIYTFPISAYSISGGESDAAFSVAQRSELYDKNYMMQFVEEEKSSEISTLLDCSHDETYLSGQTVILECNSPEFLQKICLEEVCFSNSNTATFEWSAKNIGTNTLIIETTTLEGIRKHFFTIQVEDQAKIIMPNISITQDVSFEEFATLKVQLIKNSSTNPRNVTMYLDHEMLQKEWFFSFLDKDKSFDIELPAQGFVAGENIFTVSVTYLDSEDNWQNITSSTSTRHTQLTTMQTIIVYYNTYASKAITYLTSFVFTRYYAELIAPGAIMVVLFSITSLFKNLTNYLIRRRKYGELKKLK